MRRRVVPLLVCCALALAATACRVRADVVVEVRADGSGTVEVTVELDPAAARRLGDHGRGADRDRLALGDLEAAGWSLEEPERADDGSVTFVARRPFAGPDQLGDVLDEVGGVDGVFRDVRLDVEDRFGSTEYRFASEVHLTGSPEQFSDAFLTEVLDGLPLARSPEELVAAGADDPEAITLGLTVSLPGGDPNADGAADRDRSSWEFPVTGGEPSEERVTVSSVTSRGRTGVLVGIAVVATVAALAAVTVGLLRRRA